MRINKQIWSPEMAILVRVVDQEKNIKVATADEKRQFSSFLCPTTTTKKELLMKKNLTVFRCLQSSWPLPSSPSPPPHRPSHHHQILRLARSHLHFHYLNWQNKKWSEKKFTFFTKSAEKKIRFLPSSPPSSELSEPSNSFQKSFSSSLFAVREERKNKN